MPKKANRTETADFNRYKFLKSLSQDELNTQELKFIQDYESSNDVSQAMFEFKKTYIERNEFQPVEVDMQLAKKWLWDNFLVNFKLINGKEFIQTPESISNIKVIMLYFLKSPDFFKCENLSRLSEPSFEKGLLIVGDYGNGKTSSMMALQKTLQNIKGYHFRAYNANEVVQLFEQIKNENYTFDLSRKDFDHKMNQGDIYFDDVKTEREASNYGKVNLFREIFELRSRGRRKTYITCNYKKGKPGDLAAAIDEFDEKYGERVYDRIFEKFNIIEFNGKSFRK